MIISGTDTDIGKTVVAAMLTLGLGFSYFKPIQCGRDPQTDEQAVRRMTGLGGDRILSTSVTLHHPLSPHRAAELDGVDIDLESLTPPPGNIIIEGAGGLLVPVNRNTLLIDVFKTWQQPLVLVARTGLGTLNHTLLSLEALKVRNMDVLGVIFVGDDHADNIKTIAEMGDVKILGRMPWLDPIHAESLQKAFENHFKIEDFGGAA